MSGQRVLKTGVTAAQRAAETDLRYIVILALNEQLGVGYTSLARCLGVGRNRARILVQRAKEFREQGRI